MPTCRSVVMPVLMPRATPIHNSARLHILEAYIETLKAENESLKRQLAAAKKRVARETAKAEATIADFFGYHETTHSAGGRTHQPQRIDNDRFERSRWEAVRRRERPCNHGTA